jgi:hypothetical protein
LTIKPGKPSLEVIPPKAEWWNTNWNRTRPRMNGRF